MAKRIENIEELRKEVIENFRSFKSGDLGMKEANTVVNFANTIVKSAKVELDYNKEKGYTDRKIDFLEA